MDLKTWTLRKEDIKRLKAFEMWIWWRMERVNWMEFRTNEEMLQIIFEKRSMIEKMVVISNEIRLPSKNND